MAEAIGFLLAIAGLYSSCIDAFDQIRTARSFGRDYEILSTRFDVRKARVLQWGDGVGLLSEPQDGRHPNLDNPSLRPAVERVLCCIRMPLTDTESLRSKYGLQQIADNERLDKYGSTDASTAATISRRRRDLFRASYNFFQARMREGQKDTSLARKTQWALAGRSEFQTLISDLDDMIEDLYRLVPVQPAFRRLMVKEDIASLPGDLATLKLVQEACAVDIGAEDLDPWLEAASVRVEMTEFNTQDRRGIDDCLAEVPSEQSFTGPGVEVEHSSILQSKSREVVTNVPATHEGYTSSRLEQGIYGRPWTMQEDFVLCQARTDGLGWNGIQELYFPTKTANACSKRHERLMGLRSDTVEQETSLRAIRFWICDGTCPNKPPTGPTECHNTKSEAVVHLIRNHSPPLGFSWHKCDANYQCGKASEKAMLCPEDSIKQVEETIINGRLILRAVAPARNGTLPEGSNSRTIECIVQLRSLDFVAANADIVLIQHFRTRVFRVCSFFESFVGLPAAGQRVLFYLNTLRILAMRTESIALFEDDPCRFQVCLHIIEELRDYTKVYAWLGSIHEKNINGWDPHDLRWTSEELEEFSVGVSEVVDTISLYSVNT